MLNLIPLFVSIAVTALFLICAIVILKMKIKGVRWIPYAVIVAAVAVWCLALTALGYKLEPVSASLAAALLTGSALCLVTFRKKACKGSRKKTLLRRLALAAVVTALLELSVFSYSSYAAPADSKVDLTLTNAADSSTVYDDGLLLSDEDKTYFSWQIDNVDVQNVALTFTSRSFIQTVTVDVSVADRNFSTALMPISSQSVIIGDTTSVLIPVSSKGMNRLSVAVSQAYSAYLSSVSLNAPKPIAPNLARLAILTGLIWIGIFVYTFGLHREEYDHKRREQLIVIVAAAIACCVLLFTITSAHINDYYCNGSLLMDYDRSSVGKDPYYQMFDSFHKGRLDLDIEADERLLGAGEQAYDSNWRHQNGITEEWDRSYYNGKYYSYYGTAPLFLFYYPVYVLTGRVPTTALTCFFFGALCALFGFLLILRLARTVIKRANFLLTLLCAMLLPLASGIFILVSYGDFYNLPKLCGLAFLLLMYYLSVVGYERPRWYIFLLCGLCGGIIVAARPSLVIMALALAPLYIGVLAKKDLAVGKKLMYVGVFILPIAAIGAGLMAYNAARFGSPLEFGTKYQITVNNIAMNNLSLGFLGFAVYHYFFQPFKVSPNFPFLSPAYVQLDNYSRYFYITMSFGAFTLPLNWSLLAYPAVRRRSGVKPVYRWVVITSLIAALVTAFFDFCMGGLTMSYLCDIAMLVAVASVIVLLAAEAASRPYPSVHKGVYIGAVILIGLTFFVCFMLLLGMEPYFIRTSMPGLYSFTQSLFAV